MSHGQIVPFHSPRVTLVPALALCAALMVCAAIAATEEPAAYTSVAVCGHTDQPPKIDGVLDDPAWRTAAMLGPFVLVATHEPATQPTICRVTRDDERLYVSFECAESRMGAVEAQSEGRDNPRAWTDDCVHMFIAPEDPRREYYHVIVTTANTLLDERVIDDGQERMTQWNGDVQSATKRLADRWTCELSVPWSDLRCTTAPTAPATFCVARAENPGQEWSSWCLLNAGFHEFTNFGRLSFAAEPVITGLDLPLPFVGRNDFRVSLGAATGTYVAQAQILRDEQVYPKTRLRLGGGASATFGYDLQEEGPGALRLAVTSEDGTELLYASPAVSFEVPTVRRLSEDLKGRMATTEAALAGAPAGLVRDGVRAELKRLQAEAAGVARTADQLARMTRAPRAPWAQLHDQLTALERRVRAVELKGALVGRGATKLPDFGLGVASSLVKLAPDATDYSLAQELRLKACRRERESGQVVVASLGQKVSGVHVQWSGLDSPEGGRIEHDSIEVSLVGYVTTRKPVYTVERVGRWPDPLMPLETFDVPAGEVQPLWVTVSVPPDARPGTYAGTVTVSSDSSAPQTIRVNLEVWDVELPLHGKLKTAFGCVVRGDMSQWYGFKGDPPEDFRHKLYSLLLRNRVNPASLYIQEVWPLWSDFDWCYDRGLNALSLGSLEVADTARLSKLAEGAERLRQRGLLDMAYVYGYGETDEESLGRARDGFSKVRRLIPGLRRACPIAPTKALWNYVSIWNVLTSDYDPVIAWRRQQLGEEVWWYVCCGPRHPYANFFIDYPATDARTLFWEAYKQGVQGFSYYETAMWASNMLTRDIGDPALVIHEDPEALTAMREGKRWPQVPWNTFTFSRYNGDGQLIYPGPNQTPLPSLCLEVIRDGIEDYELLNLLEETARNLQKADTKQLYGHLVDESMRLLGVNPQVVRDLTHYTSDPGLIAAERERIARQIMRLQRAAQDLRSQPAPAVAPAPPAPIPAN
jgi:hypothetical protein